jgi:hypothetical protein
MPQRSELVQIAEEVFNRFHPTNPIARAVAERLIKSLWEQRRCETMLASARSITPEQLKRVTPEKRATFEQNLRKLTERVRTLERSCREYSESLNASTREQQRAA